MNFDFLNGPPVTIKVNGGSRSKLGRDIDAELFPSADVEPERNGDMRQWLTFTLETFTKLLKQKFTRREAVKIINLVRNGASKDDAITEALSNREAA